MGKFVITKCPLRGFHFDLKTANGQLILSSLDYPTKEGCEKGLVAATFYSFDDSLFNRQRSENGKYFFKLRTQHGEEIGKSSLYDSPLAMEQGIATLKRHAPDAVIVDLSAF